uniref:SAM domain-containing protein n=1 Tax=Timema poppense TaxID=170557 RepID=A0A7R9H9K4_TIMPO|nr:unnamed protein product [Timema poppensis]
MKPAGKLYQPPPPLSFSQEFGVKIDGKSLLNLTEDDIFELTGGKVGPSLKIHDLIQQLKARVNPSQSRFKGGIGKKMF